MPSPLSFLRVHHFAVITRDTERSCRFYEQVLGFCSIGRPKFTFGGAWLYDEASDLQVHVIEHPAAREPDDSIDTKTNHIALVVPDLDVAEARLKEHGIRYHRQVNAGGYQQIFFRDPDGHHIELGVYPETHV